MRINSEAEKVEDEMADWRDETNREVLQIFCALALISSNQKQRLLGSCSRGAIRQLADIKRRN